jgi:hypothetical protein
MSTYVEMDAKKFEQLERQLFHAMKKVRNLQKKYRKEVGQDFVPTSTLPKPDMPQGYNPCKNNHGCFSANGTILSQYHEGN